MEVRTGCFRAVEDLCYFAAVEAFEVSQDDAGAFSLWEAGDQAGEALSLLFEVELLLGVSLWGGEGFEC